MSKVRGCQVEEIDPKMTSEKLLITDLVNHLHSLLSQVFAPIFEDTNTYNTHYSTSLVFSVKELVDNIGSLLSSITSHLQQDGTMVDVDLILSPAVRIVSVVQTKKRNGADDAQYKKLVNILPELRDLAINYSARVLSTIAPCFWNQRTIFTEKLLKHANNGLYLGDFFVKSGFVIGKSMNDILVKQVQERVQKLVTMIQDGKTCEPPALGRKRKKYSSNSGLVFDVAAFSSICDILPSLIAPNTLILDLIFLYQQMVVYRLEHKTRLLHALSENTILNYSSEFHPCTSLLLHCLRCEQNEVDVNGLIKKVQLIVHPRRVPYPLRSEPSDTASALEEEQTGTVKVQQPILPFPELPTAPKSLDVPIAVKPAIMSEVTTSQLQSNNHEQPSATDLNNYVAELVAKIRKAKHTNDALPPIDNFLLGSEKGDEEAMPIIIDVPSD